MAELYLFDYDPNVYFKKVLCHLVVSQYLFTPDRKKVTLYGWELMSVREKDYSVVMEVEGKHMFTNEIHYTYYILPHVTANIFEGGMVMKVLEFQNNFLEAMGLFGITAIGIETEHRIDFTKKRVQQFLLEENNRQQYT